MSEMAEILLQISNFKFSAAATRQLKFVSHGDVLGTNCLRPLLQVGAPPQQAPLLRRGVGYSPGTREQLAVIMDPRPDGLLMLKDLLESLDVGHTLIRMDAVIQVIERNEGLVYLNIDHHILEYEELPVLLQANRGFETEHFKCTYNGDISVLNTNENRLRHLSMRHCLCSEPPMLPHKPSMPVPLVMLNMPCIVDSRLLAAKKPTCRIPWCFQ